MKRLTFTLIAFAFVTACTSGRQMVVQCRTPWALAEVTGPALVAREYGVISPIPLNSVQFTDSRLKSMLAVQSLQGLRTPTQTVLVQARLVNCGDTPLQVGLRTSFMDGRQAPTEPISAWQTLWLPPRALAIYEERSVAVGATAYLVELRPAP